MRFFFEAARAKENKGQATLEAAVLIPILMLLIAMLVQPTIILYDRMVMSHAAAQGCRLIATSAQPDSLAYKHGLLTQLKPIPDIDIFHIKKNGSWDVKVSGNETAETVSVKITNSLKPLPLIGLSAWLLGAIDSSGNFNFSVEASSNVQPEWVLKEGSLPSEWTKDEY